MQVSRRQQQSCSGTSVYLRESDREAIKQIRKPSSKLFRHIWRPRRRALDVAGMEDVDGNASALGGDFSEEVHGVFLQCGVRLYVSTEGGESIKARVREHAKSRWRVL
jgi:hypothetical protein